jgi:two-component system sensor histidine kinase BarA
MKSMQQRILLVGLLPALVASSLLAIVFLWHSVHSTAEALDAYGQRLAQQLAPMQEYPLFSGNDELLQTQLQSALQLEPEVLSIAVIRRDYTRAAVITRSSNSAGTSHRYRAPILASYSGIEDYAGLLTEELDPNAQVLGWIELELSDRRVQHELQQRYLWLGLSLLLAVLLAYVMSRRLAHGLSQPIYQLVEQTSKLERGDYSAAAQSNETADSANKNRIRELAALQRALTRLARVLRHREEENRAALDALSLMNHSQTSAQDAPDGQKKGEPDA